MKNARFSTNKPYEYYSPYPIRYSGRDSPLIKITEVKSLNKEFELMNNGKQSLQPEVRNQIISQIPEKVEFYKSKRIETPNNGYKKDDFKTPKIRKFFDSINNMCINSKFNVGTESKLIVPNHSYFESKYTKKNKCNSILSNNVNENLNNIKYLSNLTIENHLRRTPLLYNISQENNYQRIVQNNKNVRDNRSNEKEMFKSHLRRSRIDNELNQKKKKENMSKILISEPTIFSQIGKDYYQNERNPVYIKIELSKSTGKTKVKRDEDKKKQIKELDKKNEKVINQIYTKIDKSTKQQERVKPEKSQRGPNDNTQNVYNRLKKDIHTAPDTSRVYEKDVIRSNNNENISFRSIRFSNERNEDNIKNMRIFINNRYDKYRTMNSIEGDIDNYYNNNTLTIKDDVKGSKTTKNNTIVKINNNDNKKNFKNESHKTFQKRVKNIDIAQDKNNSKTFRNDDKKNKRGVIYMKRDEKTKTITKNNDENNLKNSDKKDGNKSDKKEPKNTEKKDSYNSGTKYNQNSDKKENVNLGIKENQKSDKKENIDSDIKDNQKADRKQPKDSEKKEYNSSNKKDNQKSDNKEPKDSEKKDNHHIAKKENQKSDKKENLKSSKKEIAKSEKINNQNSDKKELIIELDKKEIIIIELDKKNNDKKNNHNSYKKNNHNSDKKNNQNSDKKDIPKTEKIENQNLEKKATPRSEKVENKNLEQKAIPRSEKVENQNSDKKDIPKIDKIENQNLEKNEIPKEDKIDNQKSDKGEEKKLEIKEDIKEFKIEEEKNKNINNDILNIKTIDFTNKIKNDDILLYSNVPIIAKEKTREKGKSHNYSDISTHESRFSDKKMEKRKGNFEEWDKNEYKGLRKTTYDGESRRRNKDKDKETFKIRSEFSSTLYIRQTEGKTLGGKDEFGHKKTNQDTFIIEKNVNGILNFNIFGVLDGHGFDGHFASQFASRYILYKLKNHPVIKNLDNPKDIYIKLIENNYSIITNIFLDADAQIQKEKFNCTRSGTTCVLVIQLEEHIICANCGDSRAIIVFDDYYDDNLYNSKIFPLSHDCKPDLPNEEKRIKEHGGVVERAYNEFNQEIGPYRIWAVGEDYPGLAMSRSIGDMDAKKVGVIPNPKFIEYTIDYFSKYMIIASDGIWEFISNEEAMKIANKFYLRNDANGLCHELIQKSIYLWEENDIIIDDITVVVTFF